MTKLRRSIVFISVAVLTITAVFSITVFILRSRNHTAKSQVKEPEIEVMQFNLQPAEKREIRFAELKDDEALERDIVKSNKDVKDEILVENPNITEEDLPIDEINIPAETITRSGGAAAAEHKAKGRQEAISTLELKGEGWVGVFGVGAGGGSKAAGQAGYPGTEQYEFINENSFLNPLENPLSTFSIDVDTAAYSNIRRFLKDSQFPPADAVRIEEMINYFSYDYPQPEKGNPFSITGEVSACPWNKEHSLVHIGIKGKEVKQETAPPANLVFLLDVSGSMSDTNKLPLLKQSFRLLVKQLRPVDTVSIVTYAGSAGVVLNPTAGNNKELLLTAIDSLNASGSTAGEAGLKMAYDLASRNFNKEGNNRIILATDGDFNVGVSDDDELVRIIKEKRKQGIFLSILGFGNGNYKDAKMEKIADNGNGNYSYIDSILEGNKVLVNEMNSTLVTIAKDVKIQVEFNPAKVQAYRLIGYENRKLKKEDFNNDRRDAGELGAGHTVTALYEIIPAGAESYPGSVDKLKYQKNKSEPEPGTGFAEAACKTNELMTVKLRYKAPDKDKSSLIVKTILDQKTDPGPNFRFSAAVAGFGMLLKHSEYSGSLTYGDIVLLAKSAKGRDENGYRAEFISLAEKCNLLADSK